jgi:hypothetical protein
LENNGEKAIELDSPAKNYVMDYVDKFIGKEFIME